MVMFGVACVLETVLCSYKSLQNAWNFVCLETLVEERFNTFSDTKTPVLSLRLNLGRSVYYGRENLLCKKVMETKLMVLSTLGVYATGWSYPSVERLGNLKLFSFLLWNILKVFSTSSF